MRSHLLGHVRRRPATTPMVNDGPLFAKVDMGSDFSSTTLRTTVVQASTIFYDTPATLDKAERLLVEAASYGAQLVVFPEAFIGGYPGGFNFGVSIGNRIADGKEEFHKYHSAAIDVPCKKLRSKTHGYFLLE